MLQAANKVITAKCLSSFVIELQTLEELDFQRGVCGAAQQGNLQKLRGLLQRHPRSVTDDGASGIPCCLSRVYAEDAAISHEVRSLAVTCRKVNSPSIDPGVPVSSQRVAQSQPCVRLIGAQLRLWLLIPFMLQGTVGTPPYTTQHAPAIWLLWNCCCQQVGIPCTHKICYTK